MTELLPCPFCGGPALFEYVRSGGTMSSGMEPPTCYAGCKKCGVRFSGGETQGWDSTRRWYDRLEEAHEKAAENWNHRHSAEIAGALRNAERLDYIERTFTGMSNGERYLPLVMGWGKSRNGRTLREACDKYMAKEGK